MAVVSPTDVLRLQLVVLNIVDKLENGTFPNSG
jgi:hypothetical protein